MGSKGRLSGIETRDVVEIIVWAMLVGAILYGLWRAHVAAIQNWYPQIWTLPI